MDTFDENNKQKMIVEDSLYSEYKLDYLIKRKVGECFYTGSIDAYCTKCKKETIFKIVGPESYNFDEKIDELIKDPCIITTRAICARDTGSGYYSQCRNEFYTMFYLKDLVITKMGQFPSRADLEYGLLDKAFSQLESNDRNELGKAIGLFSHGIGIGSFVYLRRIFENIIEQAHLIAKNENEWVEQEYLNGRMQDRIVILKNYLPTRLVKTAQLYSILSKGIHELSEEECLANFPIVKQAIQLILKEKYEDVEYDKIAKEIK
jgi:hypothetical protein